MTDFIGKSLGRYHVLEQLGEGGMATVYKAYDTHLERNVALKIIRKGAFPAEQLDRILKRFDREAKALAQFSHPNIVGVIDYGEFEESPYLVLEYISGGTLKQRLGRPVPWREAAGILLPVARALQYAHEQGIIHRDVKPSNILITESGQPMLTDFGIAKVLNIEETHTLTGTGVGIGTPEYMSPEQGVGKPIDVRTDIYSLGIVLYELITGHKPYTADTPMAVVIKHINEPLPRPAQFVPGLPEKVEHVLLKALAKQPENRFRDMKTFADALEALISGEPLPVTKPAYSTRELAEKTTTDYSWPVEANQPRAQRRFLRWTPLFIVGLLVCVGLAVVSIYLIVKSIAAKPSATATHVIPSLSTETVIAPLDISITDTPAIAPSESPSPARSDRTISPKDGMELVFVPAEEFTMGSNDSGFDDEKPAHQVYLDAFWIDKTEVTNAMFLQFANTTGYLGGLEKQKISWLFGNNEWIRSGGAGWRTPMGSNSSIDNRMDHPVVQVTWKDSKAYCAWAGRRLPTEAEWEKAARGTDGYTYPWGNSFPSSDLANYGNQVGDTVPVGSYSNASPYGALDMAGNVYEWVADSYSRTYYRSSPSSNPTGPSNTDYYVMRGGSWQLGSDRLHTYEREVSQPDFGNSNLGFRCAQNENQ